MGSRRLVGNEGVPNGTPALVQPRFPHRALDLCENLIKERQGD